MERVSVLDGDLPILVVAPYGTEDLRTGMIAKRIHKEVDAFAVINWGWQCCKSPDHTQDQADCNHVDHLQYEPVVGDEFLTPLMDYVYRIHMNWGRVHLFIIQGIDDEVRRATSSGDLDLIIGYGASSNGKDPVYSCDPNMKDAFIHYLLKKGFHTWQGSGNGLYSGRSISSLNQLYRQGIFYNSFVHSLEIKIIEELRSDDEMAAITAMELADCMEEITLFDDANEELFLVPDSI